MKTYAFEDSWHLWEYFHNQSARCNLNSISSFHSSQVPNQNHCQSIRYNSSALIVMKKREYQSLFLVLSARPNWFYVARTMELPRGQTMVDQSESPTNSKDLREQINIFISRKEERD